MIFRIKIISINVNIPETRVWVGFVSTTQKFATHCYNHCATGGPTGRSCVLYVVSDYYLAHILNKIHDGDMRVVKLNVL